MPAEHGPVCAAADTERNVTATKRARIMFAFKTKGLQAPGLKTLSCERKFYYFPANCGLRFWLYAARPSFASSLWKSCCCSSRSIPRADSNGISQPLCTERLIRPTARAALFGGQKLHAYSM